MRPRGIDEGVWALGGGVLLVALGALDLSDAVRTAFDLHGVALFLIGLFWLSLAAERAGLIAVWGDRMVGLARGDGRRLLVAVVIFCTLTTALFSNDGTVVLVTPVVLQICRRLELDPLPYVFAVTFMADTASALVPVANPVNILFAERLDLSFGTHVTYLLLPTLVAIVVTTLMLLVVMRERIPRRMHGEDLAPGGTEPMGRTAWVVGACLALTAAGYVVAAIAGVEPYWVTLAGGMLALAPLIAARITIPTDLVRVQPAGLYAFVLGLALIVAAAEQQGLLDRAGELVVDLQDRPEIVGVMGLGIGAASGSNLINNWTMALVLIPPLDTGNASNAHIFASLFGTDIGPNLTVVGSLATLIWMTQLRRAGVTVTGRTYLRLGLLTTVPALLTAMLTLALVGWLI